MLLIQCKKKKSKTVMTWYLPDLAIFGVFNWIWFFFQMYRTRVVYSDDGGDPSTTTTATAAVGEARNGVLAAQEASV